MIPKTGAFLLSILLLCCMAPGTVKAARDAGPRLDGLHGPARDTLSPASNVSPRRSFDWAGHGWSNPQQPAAVGSSLATRVGFFLGERLPWVSSDTFLRAFGGPALGAAIGGVVANAVIQKLTTGSIDWGSVAFSTAGGIVGTAFMGLGGTIGGSMAGEYAWRGLNRLLHRRHGEASRPASGISLLEKTSLRTSPRP